MNGFVSNVVAFIATQFKKYWKLIASAGAYRILTWIFDNPIWMMVELKWKGAGVVAMMILAFIINTLVLIYFRNKSTKWILWSEIDELSEKEAEFSTRYNSWGQKKTVSRLIMLAVSYVPMKLILFLLWCLRKSQLLGDLVAFVILSIIEDPFVVTMYLRHGYKNGLRTRDIVIYLGSSMISIAYWTIRNGLLIELGLRQILN